SAGGRVKRIMRIVVIGAGTVGTWIADLLCRHRHSVTVVDSDPEHIRRINAELDVRGLVGSGSESSVLFQTGVSTCDICLAVTGIDEVNLIAASMAKAMGARRAVARVYGRVFHDLSTFDYQRHFRIDRLLSLEHLSAMELSRGIRNPGTVILENFARGQLEVQEIAASDETSAVGVKLKALGLPRGVRIGAISRGAHTWIAGAEDTIDVGDRFTMIGRREVIDEVKDRFRSRPEPKMSVVIAGGGETGFHLARSLDGRRFDVLLMDANRERCEYLANMLGHVTVVNADATRRAVLEEERIGAAHVFIASTGDDESNIMASIEAKQVGAKRALAIVGRPDYAEIVSNLGIDLAVSPRDVMARQILGFLNTGSVISRMNLGGSNISVMELDVLEGSPATQCELAELALPRKSIIAAVMREGFVQVPSGDDRLHVGDTVVALVEDAAEDELLSRFAPSARS
ncbi:MAG: Trk system potassium transporter TrkA, partial [Planctomycetales bacterium]|nr:Trk system potassium transporter TrkA [Planctomycetales bacterium]